MLRFALDALPELKSYRYILKVSWRYEIRNGNELVDRIVRMFADLICAIRANLTGGDSKTAASTQHVAMDHLFHYQEELEASAGKAKP